MINCVRVTRALAALASVGLVAGACAKERPDAYGTFEATEVTLSAEVAGRLLAVHADEGTAVAAGTVVAVVDTSPLVLQRGELRARRTASSVASHVGRDSAADAATSGPSAPRMRA